MTGHWGPPTSFNQSSVMTTCFIYSITIKSLNTHTQKLSQMVSKVSSNSNSPGSPYTWL